jgi:hypothetical protein
MQPFPDSTAGLSGTTEEIRRLLGKFSERSSTFRTESDMTNHWLELTPCPTCGKHKFNVTKIPPMRFENGMILADLCVCGEEIEDVYEEEEE